MTGQCRQVLSSKGTGWRPGHTQWALPRRRELAGHLEEAVDMGTEERSAGSRAAIHVNTYECCPS